MTNLSNQKELNREEIKKKPYNIMLSIWTVDGELIGQPLEIRGSSIQEVKSRRSPELILDFCKKNGVLEGTILVEESVTFAKNIEEATADDMVEDEYVDGDEGVFTIEDGCTTLKMAN